VSHVEQDPCQQDYQDKGQARYNLPSKVQDKKLLSINKLDGRKTSKGCLTFSGRKIIEIMLEPKFAR
jgi:hypothetical protein